MGNGMIRLRRRDEARIVETVASLLAGGIGLLDAYRWACSMHRGAPRDALKAIVGQLEGGAAIASATESVVVRLDPMHRAMLRVVDETGETAGAMARCSRFLSAGTELRTHTARATVYPAVVTIVAIAGAFVVLLLVVPAAGRLVATTGTGLGQAEAIAARGAGLAGAVGIGTLLAIAAGALTVLTRDVSRATPRIARLRLAIPVLGRMEALTALLGYAHAAAALVAAGSPLGTALTRAADCVGNAAIRGGLAEAARLIDGGIPPSQAFARKVPRFTHLQRWFSLAEAGADLQTALEALTASVETELRSVSARVAALAEPVLTLVAGAIVMAVVLTVVKPLFELYGSVLP